MRALPARGVARPARQHGHKMKQAGSRSQRAALSGQPRMQRCIAEVSAGSNDCNAAGVGGEMHLQASVWSSSGKGGGRCPSVVVRALRFTRRLDRVGLHLLPQRSPQQRFESRHLATTRRRRLEPGSPPFRSLPHDSRTRKSGIAKRLLPMYARRGVYTTGSAAHRALTLSIHGSRQPLRVCVGREGRFWEPP